MSTHKVGCPANDGEALECVCGILTTDAPLVAFGPPDTFPSTHHPRTGQRLSWSYPTPPASLEEAVQTAVGGASACWENLAGAGVFQDDRALEVSSALIEWIKANYVPRTTFGGTAVEGQTTFGGNDV